MDHIIAGADRPLGQHVATAIRVADEPAGLADDGDARRDVPSLQIALPKTIVTAGGDEAKIEGGGPKPANGRGRVAQRESTTLTS